MLPAAKGEFMAKKSIIKQFRDFVDALPAESNKPMTRKEITTARAKRKTRRSAKKRATKRAAKNATKKSIKKAVKKKKGKK
jgi:hypothetical protein